MLGGVPDLFIGAAVGGVLSAAYNDLYNLAKDAVVAAAWCKKFCRQLATNLELFQPLFLDICSAIDQNRQLYFPSARSIIAFKDSLQEGQILVQKCLAVKRLNLFQRHHYGKAILKLEKEIGSFIQKLSAVNTQILVRQQILCEEHKDQLQEVAQTQHDFGQGHKQQLQELGRDQVQRAHELDLQLQQLSKDHKLRTDELKETLNLAIEKMGTSSSKIEKMGTPSSEIAASLQQLMRQVVEIDTPPSEIDTSTVDGQLTSSLQDTLNMMPQFVVGIEHPLEEVKEQLLAKKQSVMIVGVNGMGGLGKTTLALALCHDAEIKAYFNEKIYFVTVSQSPNMMELFKILWQKLIGEELPWFQNEEDAQRQLQGAVTKMKSPVLLVLDDVWSRAHLEKLAFEGEQCRILYTTRQASTSPVRNTFVYNLSLLSEEQALCLFCFWAFGQQSIPEWADASLVKEVKDECKRLPLALKVIGGSLSGQPAIAWQNAKKRLRRAQTIGDYHTDALLKCLQTSFDVLDVQLQQCFIDLGSFPEDKDIPVRVLFDIWMNVRGMEWDDAVMALVELSSRCLVDVFHEYSEGTLRYGIADGLECRQHDVMRDLALYLGHKASAPNPKSLKINHEDLQPHLRKWLVMPHKEQKIPDDWQSHSTTSRFAAEIVSLNIDVVAKEDWPHGISFSATQALLLYTDTKRYALPPFIESMSELKVLVVENPTGFCKFTGFEACNSLINLQSIKLGGAFAADKLCVLPASLKQMSLNSCFTLVNLPDNIVHNLSNLVLLNLRGCRNLKALPDSLCKLQQMQHLDISFCEKIERLPDDLGQLSNLKVLNLQWCSSLTALPATVTELQSLELLIVGDCSALEKLPDDLGKLSKLQKLEMEGCHELQELPSSVKEFRALKSVSCDYRWAAQWKAAKEGLVTTYTPRVLRYAHSQAVFLNVDAWST